MCHSPRGNVEQHVIVAETLIGPRPFGMQVCHNDGNPLNNHPSNLRWGTPKQNGEDKVRHGRSLPGEKNPFSKLTDSQVKEIKSCYTGAWGQQTELARKYGVTQARIQQIVGGRR